VLDEVDFEKILGLLLGKLALNGKEAVVKKR
jgi:hypothetical protein